MNKIENPGEVRQARAVPEQRGMTPAQAMAMLPIAGAVLWTVGKYLGAYADLDINFTDSPQIQ